MLERLESGELMSATLPIVNQPRCLGAVPVMLCWARWSGSWRSPGSAKVSCQSGREAELSFVQSQNTRNAGAQESV